MAFFDVSLKLPPCSKTLQEAQTDLNHTAAELNHSAGEVVHSSRGTSSQLAAASGKFSQDFDEFLDAGVEMAGHTQVGFIIVQRTEQSSEDVVIAFYTQRPQIPNVKT